MGEQFYRIKRKCNQRLHSMLEKPCSKQDLVKVCMMEFGLGERHVHTFLETFYEDLHTDGYGIWQWKKNIQQQKQ